MASSGGMYRIPTFHPQILL
jgi:hypothetical protein